MAAKVPTLVSLTNAPTPYRVHFYEALACSLEDRGMALQVIFMTRDEVGRNWSFRPEAWSCAHTFVPGLHPVIGRHVFHLNPTCPIKLMVQAPEWLLVSGSWYFPTVPLAALAVKPTGTKTLFWSESNLAYMEHNSPRINRWRGMVMDWFDGFVVPGRWARDYVLHFSPTARTKPILTLPNVVDESRYRNHVAERRLQRRALLEKWSVEQETAILLTPARLEPIKGVRELVSALLNLQHLDRLTLLLAGTGSLAAELETQVRQAGMQERIRLLGHQSEENILDLLAISDALILPSLGDAYPLAVVEAAFAGLPLLLSNRVGCHPEMLMPARNGLLFDPQDSASIQDCIDAFLAFGQERWREMGVRSLKLADARFRTDHVVARFVEELVRL